ncbi:olfactory receptor 14C36-like [Cygnus olor]|uniref:olfactory receptor 14C36-like n=1 Tax=Cygnus olor TaxID=8869 RepID=UPI001ADE59A0|nr:olfactory receptor 14C36-like [Cygnus olor]
MAYDRYVAVCKPLHYRSLLGSRACAQMAAAAWGSCFLYALLHTANTFSLPLCGQNTLDQFFCEIPSVLKLSCSDSYLREVWLLLVGVCLASGCFVFIILSYVQIFRAVLRMPSEQGWHKAFSTCLPHLAVVSLFINTCFFAYLKPPSISSPSLNLVVAVLYSVIPPILNPLIYSMRSGCQAFQKLVPLSITYQTLSIICQWSWSSGEVPDDWRLPNMKPIYKKFAIPVPAFGNSDTIAYIIWASNKLERSTCHRFALRQE